MMTANCVVTIQDNNWPDNNWPDNNWQDNAWNVAADKRFAGQSFAGNSFKGGKQLALAQMRRQLAQLDHLHHRVRMPFGVDSLDHALAGGLALGRVHLLTGNMLCHGAVSGFAIAVLAMLLRHMSLSCVAGRAGQDGVVVWCPASRQGATGMLYGHGLAAAGLDPSRLLLVDAPGPAHRLAALDDILRTGNLAAVVVEYDGLQKSADYWMRLARRTQLAAEAGDVTALLLGAPIPAAGFESAWHIQPAPKHNKPDHKMLQQTDCAVWDVRLERARGGRPHACRLGWHPQDKLFVARPDGMRQPGASAGRLAVLL
jgi:protein ImuA